MAYETIKDAANAWVDSFNAIPTDMLLKLWENGSDIFEVTVSEEDEDGEEHEYDSVFPMWGTMWSFGDSADDYWLEELNGVKKMSECGFRIYDTEWGYYFGIDGMGYSFTDEHFLPLYKARGLHWHKTEE